MYAEVLLNHSSLSVAFEVVIIYSFEAAGEHMDGSVTLQHCWFYADNETSPQNPSLRGLEKTRRKHS